MKGTYNELGGSEVAACKLAYFGACEGCFQGVGIANAEFFVNDRSSGVLFIL